MKSKADRQAFLSLEVSDHCQDMKRRISYSKTQIEFEMKWIDLEGLLVPA